MADQLAFDIIGKDKASPAFGKVSRAIEGTERAATSLQRSMDHLGTAAVATAAGFGALEVWNRTVGAAVDLNESISKTRVLFGDSSAAIEDWADSAEQSMGLSKRSALDGVSAFENLFQQIEISADQSQRMSTSLVQLASDFASFHNARPEDVMLALQGATRGEYDELQRFVPTVSDAAVEARALADSGKATASALTAADKAVGLYNLVVEDAGAATGDFARTSDGAANQQRILLANIENTGAAIGQTLLPAYQGFLSVINDVGPLAALGAVGAVVFGKQIGENVQLASTAIGVWGLELKDSVIASRAASLETSRFGTALNVVKSGTSGASKALGGMVGLLGGPWGVALAGAALGVGYLTQQAGEQRQRTEGLTESLKQLSGTYSEIRQGSTATAESIVAQNEDLQDLILSADRFGVTIGDIVGALAGEQGKLELVNQSYDARIDALRAAAKEQNVLAAGVSSEHGREIARLEAQKAAINATLQARGRAKVSADLLKKAVAEEGGAAVGATEAQIKLSDAMTVLGDTTATAEDRVKALKVAQDALFGAQISQSEAMEAYEAAVDSMTDSIESNGTSLDVNTKAGRANRDAIEGRLEASKRMVEADIEAGVSAEEATRRHKARTEALRREGRAAGLSKKETDKLIATYGAVPTDVETVIRTKGDKLTSAKLLDLLALQKSLRTGISLSRAKAEQKKALGSLFASGGPVDGPGTKTSDDVPAWLSTGEYVHTAAAVDYYGPGFMKAINERRIDKRALIDAPGYARGGRVQRWPFPVDASRAAMPTEAEIRRRWAATMWPTPGYRNITSPYGANRGSYFHGGTDIGAPYGASIVAAKAGRVIQAGWYGGGGNTVSLAHSDALVTRYMHMSRILADVGRVVEAGMRIGKVGSTGDSTGPHLHFQAERGGRTFNPMTLFDSGGWLMPGLTMALNNTGRPERVSPPGRGGAVTVNINGPVFGNERAIEREVARALSELKRKGAL